MIEDRSGRMMLEDAIIQLREEGETNEEIREMLEEFLGDEDG